MNRGESMNRTQILYFLTVAKYLNFSEASRQLYVSQSSISKQISLLEEEFEVKLFNRTNKYVELTAAGDVLCKELTKFDDWIYSIAERAHNADAGLAGTLNISILHNVDLFSSNITFLREFSAKYPGAVVNLQRLSLEQLEDTLITGQSDIVITLSSMVPEIEFSSLELKKGHCYIALSKIFEPMNRTHFTVADFHSLPFVTISPAVSLDANLNHLLILDKIGITPVKVKYSRSMDDLLLQLEAGFGYTIINNLTMLYKRETIRTLNPYEPAPPPSAANIVAIWTKDNTNPMIKTYTNFVKENQSV